ncbi:MAG: heme biosynthesis HemY N-terminal domain-containing protein [Gammaproteobacteria bacterium]
MRRFIVGMIILILSVWLGLRIAEDPGLALFTYRDWSMQMPLWFAAVCLIVLTLFVYYLVRFIDGIDSSFYRWKNWLRWRRKNKSYSKTNRGLIELIEGHWRTAENFLLEGINQSDAPLVNYLAAAKAAHERGAFDKRDLYLRKAHDLAPQADVAIGLTQAQLQLDQGQLEQALATLNHLRTITPLHAVVLKLLQKTYIRLADWKALLLLLPSMRKAKTLTPEQLDVMELRVYQELLSATANKADNAETMHEFWKIVPRKAQKNSQLIYTYAKQLMRFPYTANEVEVLINTAVKKNWDSDLVRLYGLLVTENPKKQLSHAEKWMKHYPDQPILLLTLGRLCLQCQLWGKARGYLEESLRLEANPETYVEYGKLFEQLGDVSTALVNYRDGLGLVAEVE